MESADLNSPPPDDEQLAAWYRANVSTAPLSEDGFSQAVLASLPPAQNKVATSRRLSCLAGALVGTALALLKVSIANESWPELTETTSALTGTFTLPPASIIASALGVTLLSLWYVFRPKLEFRPRF